MYVLLALLHCWQNELRLTYSNLGREEHFYAAEGRVVALLCGPPAMIEKAAVPGLKEMGFEEGKTMFGY